MTIRLSRGEFWLLANVVEHALPLPLLAMPEWAPGGTMDTIDIVLNRQGHGLEFAALAETLSRMSMAGWIEFDRTFLCEPIPRPGIDEIVNFLGEQTRFDKASFYRLTGKGGKAWEAFARPEWNKYIHHDFDFVDDGTVDVRTTTIIAADRKRLDGYLEALALEEAIEADSILISELRPWQATYWKTLPSGLQCTFRSKERRSSGGSPDAQRMRQRWCEWR